MLLNPLQYSFHDASLDLITYDHTQRHLWLAIEINLGIQQSGDLATLKDDFRQTKLIFNDVRSFVGEPLIPALMWDDLNESGAWGDILDIIWNKSEMLATIQLLIEHRPRMPQEYCELLINYGSIEWHISAPTINEHE